MELRRGQGDVVAQLIDSAQPLDRNKTPTLTLKVLVCTQTCVFLSLNVPGLQVNLVYIQCLCVCVNGIALVTVLSPGG